MHRGINYASVWNCTGCMEVIPSVGVLMMMMESSVQHISRNDLPYVFN